MDEHPPSNPAIEDPSLEALAAQLVEARLEENKWAHRRAALERELLKRPAVQGRLLEDGSADLRVGNYLIGTRGSLSFVVTDNAAFEAALQTIPLEMRPIVTRMGRPVLDTRRLIQMRAERPDLYARLEPTLRVTQRTRVLVKTYSCPPGPTKDIEIYVRQSGDRVLLNLHLTAPARSHLLYGLREGTFEPRGVRIYLELSAQGEWLTLDGNLFTRRWATEEAPHLRIPITAINVVTTD